MHVVVELLSLPVVFLAAWACGKRLPRLLHRGVRGFSALACRRRLCVVLVGALAFAGCALTSVAMGWPRPNVHDEYSYALLADTFAHGRLSNPAHPMWQHFETFQVIQQPTYASKYPVAQGVFLCIGQVLTGQPIVGVWLSMALACAALCWMLQAYFPPRWALLGALLFTVRLVACKPTWQSGDLTWGYWGRGYFGGAVAMLGGVLLYGALRRIVDRPRAACAVVMALGVALLANSRPFEGLVVSLPAAVVLAVFLLGKNRPGLGVALGRVVLPAGAVLLLVGAWMALYNQRVTGTPFRMAYMVHESTYAANPMFVWQKLTPPPTYRHALIGAFHTGWIRDLFLQHQSVRGWLAHAVGSAAHTAAFYFGPWLMFAAAAVFRRRDPWVRLAVAGSALLLAAMTQVFCYAPHYAAPGTALFAVVAVAGLRQCWVMRRPGLPNGQALVLGAVLCYPLMAVLSGWWEGSIPAGATHLQREALLEQLRDTGEKHLVVVRYRKPWPNGHVHEEWVVNEPDIDGSPVVWAREMNPDADRALLDYFADRRVWLLTVEMSDRTHRLTPHPASGGAALMRKTP